MLAARGFDAILELEVEQRVDAGVGTQHDAAAVAAVAAGGAGVRAILLAQERDAGPPSVPGLDVHLDLVDELHRRVLTKGRRRVAPRPGDVGRENAGRRILRGRQRLDADATAVFAVTLVLDDPVGEREQREIPPHADVAAGVDPRADLADEDGACAHLLARVDLHAASLPVAVAAVAAAALSLFVSHGALPVDFQDAQRGDALAV